MSRVRSDLVASIRSAETVAGGSAAIPGSDGTGAVVVIWDGSVVPAEGPMICVSPAMTRGLSSGLSCLQKVQIKGSNRVGMAGLVRFLLNKFDAERL